MVKLIFKANAMNLFIMRSLQQRAFSEAGHAFERITFWSRRLAELNRQQAAATEALSIAEHAAELLTSYRPMAGTAYVCPCCAVESYERSELAELDGDDRVRRFLCPTCGEHFTFDVSTRLNVDDPQVAAAKQAPVFELRRSQP